MGQQIYNEGRVVGFSAYEIYVRHLLSQDPDAKVPTEKEWLAATIGRGASMILKVGSSTSVGVHDYELPGSSTLCAAGVIVASFFDGEVEMNGCWATKVKSYGSLISNTVKSHPNTNVNELDPSDTPYNSNNTTNLEQLKSYINITEGLYIDYGRWNSKGNSSTSIPYVSFEPVVKSNSGVGCIRIRISKPLTADVYILLTGFINKTIISSLVSENPRDSEGNHLYVGDTDNPENGDFLGPEEFPWASKIIFTTPSELTYLMNNESYARKIPKLGTEEDIDDTPIIDMKRANNEAYYSKHKRYENARKTMDITKLNVINEGVAVLVADQATISEGQYSHTTKSVSGQDIPPILYGGRYTERGDTFLYPIDTGAPGTIKMFTSEDEYGESLANNYPKMLPGLYSLYTETIYENSDDEVGKTDVYLFDIPKPDRTGPDRVRKTKITTDIEHMKLTPEDGSSAESVSKPDDYVPVVKISSKDQSAKVLSLTDSDGKWLSLTGTTSIDSQTPVLTEFNNSTGALVGKGLAWSHLIHALNADRSIKILGKALAIIDEKDVIQLSSKDPSRIGGSFTAGSEICASSQPSDPDPTSYIKLVTTGRPYIELKIPSTRGNKIRRLYFGEDQPADTDIPDGSIWIGGE